MPGINGVEALRAIRQAQPQTPVILMTAYAAHELLAQAEREGALMVLPKPMPWPTLTGLLDRSATAERSILMVDDDPEFLGRLSEVAGRAWARYEGRVAAAGAGVRRDQAPRRSSSSIWGSTRSSRRTR